MVFANPPRVVAHRAVPHRMRLSENSSGLGSFLGNRRDRIAGLAYDGGQLDIRQLEATTQNLDLHFAGHIQ